MEYQREPWLVYYSEQCVLAKYPANNTTYMLTYAQSLPLTPLHNYHNYHAMH